MVRNFLQMDKMTKVHDGKVAGEQLVKSLAKAFSESNKARIDIVSEYDKRRLSF